MTTDNKTKPTLAQLVHQHDDDERHVMDYVRVLYKRRWVAIPAFLIVFTIGTINSFRTTPVYEAHTQLLIEKDTPKVGNLTTMFQETEGWYNDDFYQTQMRILESRTLARRPAELMNLPKRPVTEVQGAAPISLMGTVKGAARWIKRQVVGKPAKPPVAATASSEPADPMAPYIAEVMGGLSVTPVRNSRLVDISFSSSDPQLA